MALVLLCAALVLTGCTRRPAPMAGEQAMADITLGLLATQAFAAEGCDRLQPGHATFLARHRRIAQAHARQFDQAREIRLRTFQARYGERAADTLSAQDRAYREELAHRMQIDAAFCAAFDAELDARLSRGWGYLQAKIDQTFKGTRPPED